MPSITYLLRSKNNNPFILRLQIFDDSKISETNKKGISFLEAKTNIWVFTNDELKDFPMIDPVKYWRDNKKYKGYSQEIKDRIIDINSKQKDLKDFVLSRFDLSFDEKENKLPSKEWLTSAVAEYYDNIKKEEDKAKRNNTPTTLLWHFDNYIRLKSIDLGDRTVLKLKDMVKILTEYEAFESSRKGYKWQIEVSEVDEDLKYRLSDYLLNIKSYSRNTVAKTIKVIRTICNYSPRYGITLSNTYDDFKMAYEDKDVVFLSFDELKRIKNTDVPKELQNAKDWLYLSCFLGQRISDFMRFEKSMIVKKGDNYTIDFIQEKTGKKMQLVLHPEVLNYLKDNDMSFPQPIPEQRYNDQIKTICKLAGITEKIKGSVMTEIKKGIWRNKAGVYPKYELIGSHIGRKSFASNFYGLIPTTLIMQVTGHSEERTLLEYIGKKDDTNNAMIQNYYNNIKI